MKKKDLSKQRKNIVVREVKMDDSNNLMRSTFTVKKGQSVAFVVRDKNNKVRPLNYDKYEIHVEGIGSISTHYEAMDIGVPDRKKYQKIITKQYSNLSFKERVDIIKKPLTHLFRANKKNTTFRIILKSKETNFETHIFINVDANLIPYIMIPVGLIGGAAIVALPLIYHQKHEKPKETTQAMVVDLIEDEKNASNSYIVFPSNMTQLSVDADDPYYYFRNNSVNHVYFHYYIYNYETHETIDIGQIEPADDKALKVNMLKFFDKGTHKVRIDIRTFKDQAETIEKHPMSYKSTITIN